MAKFYLTSGLFDLTSKQFYYVKIQSIPSQANFDLTRGVSLQVWSLQVGSGVLGLQNRSNLQAHRTPYSICAEVHGQILTASRRRLLLYIGGGSEFQQVFRVSEECRREMVIMFQSALLWRVRGVPMQWPRRGSPKFSKLHSACIGL